jgi:hypothetical protein
MELGMGTSLGRMKQDGKFLLLRAAGIQRIHIIGCARSGTTMLHYAMAAFADTILYDSESGIWAYPSLSECFGLALDRTSPRRTRYLVTKRHYGWFLDEEIEKLIYSAHRHQLLLINIVRDPRDVLTSHKRGSRDGFYVELERWQKSVEASTVVLNALQGCASLLTLRYEDVINAAEPTAALLQERFGLRLRPHVRSWANLQDNVATLGQRTDRAQAMHGVRNFDPGSIGRWSSDPESRHFVEQILDESSQRELLRRFMATYNYSL